MHSFPYKTKFQKLKTIIITLSGKFLYKKKIIWLLFSSYCYKIWSNGELGSKVPFPWTLHTSKIIPPNNLFIYLFLSTHLGYPKCLFLSLNWRKLSTTTWNVTPYIFTYQYGPQGEVGMLVSIFYSIIRHDNFELIVVLHKIYQFVFPMKNSDIHASIILTYTRRISTICTVQWLLHSSATYMSYNFYLYQWLSVVHNAGSNMKISL